MDIKKLFWLGVAASTLVVGCSPSADSKPTAQEIKTFKGTPLTPEQVAKLRGSMGGGGGPMSAGPHNAGGAAPATTPPAGG